MPITYPAFFAERLANDLSLRAAVDGSITDFSDWLKDSKLPFFPDYTDHGPEHVSQVLATAEALIPPHARPFFTASDTAVLILATLLHDSAMHISEAGFKQLIVGDASRDRISEFDSVCWPDLWRDFLFAAKRWDDRKLVDIFGESADGSPRAVVRDVFDAYENLTETDRKLIGEFIRMNHPRLAHQFAEFGVPGPTSARITPDRRFGTELCGLAGLVARSHGLPIRKCLDYLSHRYHRREYQGVHAVYVMALLRVADYLQIQSSRAPSIAFRYKHIPSRASSREWRAHAAVKNITRTHDDPESIEIQAHPEDVATYLRLKDWLVGIQSELDASWAVLGEVYGSHEELRHCGLIIRRVRSNLDDDKRFSETVTYVPQRFQFNVARSELLRLLIRPLYNDTPEVGVRELLQNAVDAVREMQCL
ncbi:MAG TPA: hypothetical protein VND64_07355, partial [Pirellulales bacterium]|nr:hypothetical protein [Pirellulales bacterium]